MLIEEALGAVLAENTGITDLVGERIHAVTIPQDQAGQSNQYPAIVYALIARDRSDTHQGPDGLVKSTFQIDCLATDYAGVKHIAAAVAAALNGQQAAFNAIFAERAVRRVICEDESDDYIYDDVEKTALYHVPQRYLIQHREGV